MKAASVFSDNMVLQRRANVRIFGTCSASERKITVRIPELGVYAEACTEDGKWEAVLPPMEACESCTLELTCGAVKKIFRSVAVGEVWLAGGQSNMEFELQNDKNGQAALASCCEENVRFYYTPKCGMNDDELLKAEANTSWMTASPENSRAWSAVGYYFAKELSRRLGVTVGIIGCNWGGTSASAWMDRKYLEQDDRISVYIREYDEAVKGRSDQEMIEEYNEYCEYQSAWEKRMQKCYEEEPDISWDEVIARCGENRYPGPVGISNPMRPCGLYETMISRVCPYTLRGFLYYQGESDDHRPDTYYVLLKALIENWRRDWKDDTLPFLMVQLPMFRYAADPDYGHWAVIREAQMRVYQTVKNTGLAVALDCGEFNNIHPVDKAPVGHRLYLQALSEVYGLAQKKETFPAVYRAYSVEGSCMRLYFDNCGGFTCGGEVSGFEIAGADNIYHPAKAEICGETILLSCDEVSYPVSARYQWINYAEVSLFCKNGLPLSTFRTNRI